MHDVVLFALLGLGPGALIAGLALGLVLTYRGSGTINMASGALAVVGAYTFYGLRTDGYLWVLPIPGLPHQIDLGGPWPTVPAIVAAVVVTGVVGLAFDLLVLRPLRSAPQLARLLASLGLLIVLQAAVTLRFGSDGQQAPTVFPEGPKDTATIFGATVPSDRLWLLLLVAVVTVALAAVYRFTRFGLATQAAAESETLAVLAGLSPVRLSATSTVLGAMVAGGLGAVAASQVPLDPITVPLTIIPALVAAVVGRFTSFGLTAVVGVLMGVAESLVTLAQSRTWFPTADGSPLPGVTDLLFFLLVVVAVLWRGSSLPQRGSLTENALPAAPAARRLWAPAGGAGLVLVVLFLTLPFGLRQALINSLIGVLVCLSLTVITGFVGQVSLLQIALSGVAGFVVSELSTKAGLGFPVGPLLGIAAAVALGMLTAASALRVRGVSLVMVSIAGAVALQTFGFENPIWGGGTSSLSVHEPHLLGLDIGTAAPFFLNAADQPSPLFGIVCTVVVVLAAVGVAALRRGDLGKRMLAVRSDERASAAAGISVRQTKIVAFAISSAIAGLAGVLYAYNFQSVSSSRFDVLLALTFVAFAYLGGITTITGAVVAGLGVTEGFVGYLLDTYTGITPNYQLLLSGFALLVALTRQPAGVAAVMQQNVAQLTARWSARRGAPRDVDEAPVEPGRPVAAVRS